MKRSKLRFARDGVNSPRRAIAATPGSSPRHETIFGVLLSTFRPSHRGHSVLDGSAPERFQRRRKHPGEPRHSSRQAGDTATAIALEGRCSTFRRTAPSITNWGPRVPGDRQSSAPEKFRDGGPKSGARSLKNNLGYLLAESGRCALAIAAPFQHCGRPRIAPASAASTISSEPPECSLVRATQPRK